VTSLNKLLLTLVLLWSGSVCAQQRVVIGPVTYTGNRVTKEHILSREMTLHTGAAMPLDSVAYHMERSRSNLRNIQLFNFVR